MSINQCDGCRLDLPIRNGVHIFPETWEIHMACTKNLYDQIYIASHTSEWACVVYPNMPENVLAEFIGQVKLAFPQAKLKNPIEDFFNTENMWIFPLWNMSTYDPSIEEKIEAIEDKIAMKYGVSVFL